MRFSGKVAIVTGAGSGMGEAIAKRLAAESASVTVADINADAAERVAGEIAGGKGSAIAVAADVSDAKSVAAMTNRTVKEFGGIDILVNNAGKRIIKGFLQHTRDDWDQMIGINLTGPFLCAQAALPHIVKRGHGRIINVASIASYVGRPNRCAYVAAKSGLLGLTRALASDLAGTGIRVNAILPGMVASPFNAEFANDPRLGPDWQRETPAGRWGRPDDVAAVALFLASEDSDYVNGAAIPVEGGWLVSRARPGEDPMWD